jgi:hypothetical protein
MPQTVLNPATLEASLAGVQALPVIPQAIQQIAD